MTRASTGNRGPAPGLSGSGRRWGGDVDGGSHVPAIGAGDGERTDVDHAAPIAEAAAVEVIAVVHHITARICAHT